jgi:hypothetical protein
MAAVASAGGTAATAARWVPSERRVTGGLHAATRPATSSIVEPVNVREMVPIE